MSELIKNWMIVFLPLFVAIDIIGMVPLFLSLTQGMEDEHKHRAINVSALAALGIGLVFIFAGQKIFDILGITENDFRVGGGILLALIALSDLMIPGADSRRKTTSDIAIVPLAVPLILGPAALASLILLSSEFAMWKVCLSLFANLTLVWLALRYSGLIKRVLGRGGALALAKIFSILLLAYGVMMIRVGIKGF